jgi:hypothetical protein
MKLNLDPRSPTPKAQWVREGDRCISATGWLGTVLKVIPTRSLPMAKVRWDRNGHEGRVTITTIRRVK